MRAALRREAVGMGLRWPESPSWGLELPECLTTESAWARRSCDSSRRKRDLLQGSCFYPHLPSVASTTERLAKLRKRSRWRV